LKIVLCLYISWTSVELNKLSLAVVVIILIYIITTFIRRVLYNKYRFSSEMLTILEVLLSLLFTLRYIEFGVLMISLSMAEYFISEKKRVVLGIILASTPLSLVLKYQEFSDIIMILVIILIAIINDNIQCSKLKRFEDIEEKQRKSINKLQDKLAKERYIQEQILHTARLEERNKISTRLHDKIGHTISGTLLQLEAIKLIIDIDKENAYVMLDSCTENLRAGMEEIRMALRNIKPAEEELGINRIKKILDEKIKGTSIKGKVNYIGDLDKISSRIWLLFIQAITELTTNSIKYSRGDFITINIEVLKKFIKLEVKDNGEGCKTLKKGIGLSSIEDKVNNIDGKFIVNYHKEFGVIILIPY
jgi:signal transduction histidine kinase